MSEQVVLQVLATLIATGFAASVGCAFTFARKNTLLKSRVRSLGKEAEDLRRQLEDCEAELKTLEQKKHAEIQHLKNTIVQGSRQANVHGPNIR